MTSIYNSLFSNALDPKQANQSLFGTRVPIGASDNILEQWRSSIGYPDIYSKLPNLPMTVTNILWVTDTWENDMWMSEIAPPLYSDELSMRVVHVIFDNKTAEIVPIGGVPREVSHRIQYNSQSVNRIAMAASFWDDGLRSKDGQMYLAYSQMQIADGLLAYQHGANIQAILSVPSYYEESCKLRGYAATASVDDWYNRSIERWNVVARIPRGLNHAITISDMDMNTYGGQADRLLIPVEIQSYLKMVPKENTEHSVMGNNTAGFQNKFDTKRPVAEILGNKVHIVAPRTGSGGNTRYYMRRPNQQIGESFVIANRNGDSRPEKFTNDDVSGKVFDEDNDNFGLVSFAHAIEYIPAFNKDGSIWPADQPPTKPSYQGSRANAAEDESDYDADLFTVRDGLGRRAVEVLGQIKGFNTENALFSGRTLLNSVAKFYKGGIHEVNEIFDDGCKLLQRLESARFTPEWMNAFRQRHVKKSNIVQAATSTRPYERAPAILPQLRQSSGVGSYSLNNNSSGLPFGYASPWGIAQLALLSSTDPLMSSYAKIAKEFTLLGERLAFIISQILPKHNFVDKERVPLACQELKPWYSLYYHAIANTSCFAWVRVDDEDLVDQILRSRAEGGSLPEKIVQAIDYLFNINSESLKHLAAAVSPIAKAKVDAIVVHQTLQGSHPPKEGGQTEPTEKGDAGASFLETLEGRSSVEDFEEEEEKKKSMITDRSTYYTMPIGRKIGSSLASSSKDKPEDIKKYAELIVERLNEKQASDENVKQAPDLRDIAIHTNILDIVHIEDLAEGVQQDDYERTIDGIADLFEDFVDSDKLKKLLEDFKATNRYKSDVIHYGSLSLEDDFFRAELAGLVAELAGKYLRSGDENDGDNALKYLKAVLCSDVPWKLATMKSRLTKVSSHMVYLTSPEEEIDSIIKKWQSRMNDVVKRSKEAKKKNRPSKKATSSSYVQTDLVITQEGARELLSYYRSSLFDKDNKPDILPSSPHDPNVVGSLADLEHYANLDMSDGRAAILRGPVDSHSLNTIGDFYSMRNTKRKGSATSGLSSDTFTKAQRIKNDDKQLKTLLLDASLCDKFNAVRNTGANILDACVSRVLLMSPANKAVFSSMAKNHVAPAFEILGMRPHMRYTTATISRVQSGGAALRSVRGNPLAVIQNDATETRQFLQYAMTCGPLIVDQRNIYNLHNARVLGGEGGSGNVFYDPEKQLKDPHGYYDPTQGRYGGKNNEGCIFLIPVPLGFHATCQPHIDIRGRPYELRKVGYPEHITSVPTYPSHSRFCGFWGVPMKSGSNSSRARAARTLNGGLYNTECHQTQFWWYNRDTGRYENVIRSCSHWGDIGTYPGVKAARRGGPYPFKPPTYTYV